MILYYTLLTSPPPRPVFPEDPRQTLAAAAAAVRPSDLQMGAWDDSELHK